jgi:hypothetical protein
MAPSSTPLPFPPHPRVRRRVVRPKSRFAIITMGFFNSPLKMFGQGQSAVDPLDSPNPSGHDSNTIDKDSVTHAPATPANPEGRCHADLPSPNFRKHTDNQTREEPIACEHSPPRTPEAAFATPLALSRGSFPIPGPPSDVQIPAQTQTPPATPNQKSAVLASEGVTPERESPKPRRDRSRQQIEAHRVQRARSSTTGSNSSASSTKAAKVAGFRNPQRSSLPSGIEGIQDRETQDREAVLERANGNGPRKMAYAEQQKWITVQQKTFTKWLNTKIEARDLEVKDLVKDLSDGVRNLPGRIV